MGQLKQHFIPFLAHSLLESQTLEQAYYHKIQVKIVTYDTGLQDKQGTTRTISYPTSFAQGHNQHARNQN